MRLDRVALLSVGLAVFTAGAPVDAAEMVSLPGEVTYIRQDAQTKTHSADPFGVVGTINTGDNPPYALRTLFAFDTSAIPAGSTITDVNLRAWSERNGEILSGGPLQVELYALTRGFNEGEATWQSAASGESWTTPGGDFSSTLLGSASHTQSGMTKNSEFPLDETAAFTNLVQSLVGTNQVLPLIMKASATDEATNRRAVAFYGSEDYSAANYRPVLEVTYVPEPAALSLLAVGGGLLLRRGRRALP